MKAYPKTAPYGDPPASRVDKRVCRATPGNDPARALARGVPPSLLPQTVPAAGITGRVPRVLQLRAAASGLPHQGAHPRKGLLGRDQSRAPSGGLKCQHHSETGQPSQCEAGADRLVRRLDRPSGCGQSRKEARSDGLAIPGKPEKGVCV